jgi:hypothetical protein
MFANNLLNRIRPVAGPPMSVGAGFNQMQPSPPGVMTDPASPAAPYRPGIGALPPQMPPSVGGPQGPPTPGPLPPAYPGGPGQQFNPGGEMPVPPSYPPQPMPPVAGGPAGPPTMLPPRPMPPVAAPPPATGLPPSMGNMNYNALIQRLLAMRAGGNQMVQQ